MRNVSLNGVPAPRRFSGRGADPWLEKAGARVKSRFAIVSMQAGYLRRACRAAMLAAIISRV
jgi:hypothetical protein